MARSMTLVVVALGAMVLVGAGADTRPTMQHDVKGPPQPWTDKPLNNQDGTFHFAIVSDLTGGERPGVFEKAVETLNLMQPEFVMSIGDYIQGFSDNPRVFDAQWASFAKRLDKLQMRFFHVPGNHDVDARLPQVARKAWADRHGPFYYHFVYRNVLFLCLDSQMLCGSDGGREEADDIAKQVAYAAKALRDNPDVRWTFVFLHHPMWVMGESARHWAEIEKLLAPRKHTVFCGHIHRYTKYMRHGQSYITLATTGGANGPAVLKAGQFDEVAWVTVKDSGPVIANVLLDGVLDENVLTEEQVREALKKLDPKGPGLKGLP